MYVPGEEKKDIVQRISNQENQSLYPAARVLHSHKKGVLIASK